MPKVGPSNPVDAYLVGLDENGDGHFDRNEAVRAMDGLRRDGTRGFRDGQITADEEVAFMRQSRGAGLGSDLARRLAFATRGNARAPLTEYSSSLAGVSTRAPAAARREAPILRERPIDAEGRERFDDVVGRAPENPLMPTEYFSSESLRSALAALAPTDVDTSRAQRDVRIQLNALLAEYGIGPTPDIEHYATRPALSRADEFGVRQDIPAGGFHYSNGLILLSPERYQHALTFFSRELPRDRAAALEVIKGAKTAVHEAIHGASRMERGAWQGQGELVEHAMVELATRAIFMDKFGLTWDDVPSAIDYRANPLAAALVRAASESGGPLLTVPEARQSLMEASLRFFS
ncbi:MAG: hypothetical protein AAF658_17360, partial [Myxococcota bacterium]